MFTRKKPRIASSGDHRGIEGDGLAALGVSQAPPLHLPAIPSSPGRRGSSPDGIQPPQRQDSPRSVTAERRGTLMSVARLIRRQQRAQGFEEPFPRIGLLQQAGAIDEPPPGAPPLEAVAALLLVEVCTALSETAPPAARLRAVVALTA